MTTVKVIFNDVEIIEELKLFYGLPPYDTASNGYRVNGLFLEILEAKYDMTLEELCDAVNFHEVIQQWECLHS